VTARDSNNNAVPAGADLAQPRTRTEEMTAFDRLPAIVRRTLRETTFDMSATGLLPQLEARPGAAAMCAAEVRRTDETLARQFRREQGMWW